MFREFSGYMDINISHDFSGKFCANKSSGFAEYEKGQCITSKVEMRYNNLRGVQKWHLIK